MKPQLKKSPSSIKKDYDPECSKTGDIVMIINKKYSCTVQCKKY
jgi:hypothetical protein